MIANRVPADRRPRIDRVLAAASLACLGLAAAVSWFAARAHGELTTARTALARARSAQFAPRAFGDLPPVPALTAATPLLRAGDGVRVRVTILAAANPASGYARLLVTGRLSGGRPDTRYRLVAVDCPNYASTYVRATGRTGRSGTATLRGRPFTATLADFVALVLLPRTGPLAPGGVQGYLARGNALGFPAGDAPCIPVEPPYAPRDGS